MLTNASPALTGIGSLATDGTPALVGGNTCLPPPDKIVPAAEPSPGSGLVRALLLGLPVGLLVSLICHTILILWGVGLFNAPRPLAAVPTESIAVDLVPGDEAQPEAPKPPPQPEAPKLPLQLETPKPPPQPETPKPPPQPEASKPPPQPAKTEQSPPPAKTEESLPPSHLQSLLQLQPSLPPTQPPAPEAASAPGSPEPSSEQAKQDVALPLQLAAAMDMPPDLAAAARPAEISARLDQSLVSAFKARVNKCFAAPPPSADSRRVKLIVRVALNPNGTIAGNPAVVEVTAPAAGVPLMQSAMRALQQCAPYNFLPPDKYKEWRVLDLTFLPDGIR